MPPYKPKASEIASETKKIYIPRFRNNVAFPDVSFLYESSTIVASPPLDRRHCRFGKAFFERDAVDLALDWADGEAIKIPVVMPANDKRACGDWETGAMYPEECLSRRSNLYATLTNPAEGTGVRSNYPLAAGFGVYSPTVVVYRDGPEKYEIWPVAKILPIISVVPVRRPKLGASGKHYSFEAEREQMRAQIVTALRIAVWNGHRRLCVGSFGLGPGFRNPPEELAVLWRDALIADPEFNTFFTDVVFAFEAIEEKTKTSSSSGSSKTTSSSSKSSSSKSSSSKHSSSSSKHSSSSSSGSKTSSSSGASKSGGDSSGKGGGHNYELAVFRHAFMPEAIHAAYG